MSFCNGTNSINWTWGDKERNKDGSIMRCNREGKEVFKRERESGDFITKVMDRGSEVPDMLF